MPSLKVSTGYGPLLIHSLGMSIFSERLLIVANLDTGYSVPAGLSAVVQVLPQLSL